MYKVGDKVRMIRDEFGIEEGSVGTVIKVEDDDYHGTMPVLVKFGECESWPFKRNIEPVETKEQPFKPGDKVRVIRDSSY